MRRYLTIALTMVLTVAGLYGLCFAIDNPMSFEAGSIILPADSCWQPNNDPTSIPNPNNPVCDTDKNDKSIFQLYALIYALLDVGDQYPNACKNNDGTSPQQVSLFGYCKQIPIYWVIDRTKTDIQQPDLTINGTVQIFNSNSLTSATNPVYTGGPFVIKASDLTPDEFNAIIKKFPDVKIHVSNVPFDANVEKVLIGKPPKIAVLNEGASNVLEDYIRAAGLFSWKGTVFQYVTAQDIIDGCLAEDPSQTACKVTKSPFQLIWAPHWIIGKNWTTTASPTQTQQTEVLKKVREFLERGNAGFFECASIESWEGSSAIISKGERNVNPDYGGFLISQSSTAPRIDTNGGCSDVGCGSDYLVYEEAPFWLVQCGGWAYTATGGHVHNLRPAEASGYVYLTTKKTDDPTTSYDDRFMGPEVGTGRLLTRFIHDDPAKVTYNPSSDYYVYDYLVGGRINGVATQGYVVYFPGHKYVQCQNNTTFDYPPSRTLKLYFSGPLPSDSIIEMEVVHSNCTQGVDCPTVSYDIQAERGSVDADNWISVSTEASEYDPLSYTLSGINISSAFTEQDATSLQIKDIIIKVHDQNNQTVCSQDSLSDNFDDNLLASKWKKNDYGTFSSSVTESSGTINFQTTSATTNITAGNYTFLSQGPITGDFDIKVQINSVSAPALGATAYAGLMVRDQSGNFVAVVKDPNGDVYFAYKDGAVTNMNSFYNGATWLRLRRYGNQVFAMVSDNGTSWAMAVSNTFTNLSQTASVGIVFSSNDISGSAQLDNFISCVRLLNVVDLSTKESIAAPHEPFSHVQYVPISCSSSSNTENILHLQFSDDISTDPASSTVQITLYDTSGGSITASYDLSTNTGTSATSGNATLSLENAVYNPSNHTLSNILVITTGCTKYDLADVEVSFPDLSGAATLQSVYDLVTSTLICSPNATSPATCSGTSVGGGSEVPIELRIEFKDDFNKKKVPTNVGLTIDYSCGTGCSGTITASYDLQNNTGTSQQDGYVRLDMSNAIKNKNKLINIAFVNLDSSISIYITHIKITFDGNTLIKLRDETNKTDIYKWGKKGTNTSPANADVNYLIQAPASPGGGTVTNAIYSFGPGICSYYISPYLSECQIDWTKSNTCGIKYVLNTMLALKFQIASSEYTKTQPVVKQIKRGPNKTDYKLYLFQGSFDYPIYRGHLKMKKLVVDPLTGNVSLQQVWDAQDNMPPAGTGNPSSPTKNNSTRYIFTAIKDASGKYNNIAFDTSEATTLQSYLGVATTTEAEVVINSVRGRANASVSNPSGDSEMDHRLWAIEHSTPALMTNSKLVNPTGCRDLVVFAGADDGMLHAFHAGTGHYANNTCYYVDEGTGKEIWAYIPSSLLNSLKEQPFNVKYNPDNPLDYSIFEPKVSVDGSPAIGDFLVNTGTTSSPKYEWRTYLLETAEIRNTTDINHNKGILFALDVTDPYNPTVLWEGRYYDTDSSKDCKGTEKNCNMGPSQGVAIGSINVGNKLKPVAFVTALWATKQKSSINNVAAGQKPKYNHDYCTIDPETEGTCSIAGYKNRTDCTNNGGTWTVDKVPSDCVYGIGAYAIDIQTGEVIWDTKIPFTGDAIDVAQTPPIPALMDIDSNGTYDYMIFGDVQGRLWVLNTVTGKPLAGYDPTTKDPKPVFEVQNNLTCNNGTCTMPSNPTPAGVLEPIGAPVSVKGNYMVFGTGGADIAPNDRHYHIFVMQLLTTPVNGSYVTIKKIFETDVGEKIWAKPLITADFNVIIASAKNFYATTTDISKLTTTGRVMLVNLKKSTNTVVGELGGGVVGGIDAEGSHAFVITLNSQVYSIGSTEAKSYTPPATSTDNPYNILWWRKL